MQTTKLLNILEKQAEEDLSVAITHFQNMSPQVLLQPSQNGGWSIAECLWHLNSYAHFYYPLISKTLNTQTVNPIPEFKSGWLGAYFTRMMQEQNTKKYAAFKNHIPPGQLDSHATVAEFIKQQEQFIDLIRQAAQYDLNAIRIPISITSIVKLKLGDVLQFISAHNRRHINQARRNLPLFAG